jgi:TonB-linked SusC/RagA family outer membrane protein
MRVTVVQILIVCTAVMCAHATNSWGQELLNRKVTLKVQNTELGDVLSMIEQKVHVNFTYSPFLIDPQKKITVQARNTRVADLLRDIFRNAVQAEIIGEQIVLTPATATAENTGATPESKHTSLLMPISGRVTDDTGSPLPGVNILIKGSTVGTTTDGDGRYSVEVSTGTEILVFSFIGFKTQEVDVANRSQIDITLEQDITSLSEVVVIGYGTQMKSEVTGSIGSVSLKDFQEQPVTRVDQALQGRVAGVQITNSAGVPGGDVRIRVRGSNSINGNNAPLYVIDGFVGADFGIVNPQDIASMEVLKDAAATAIYGSRGANGVILITTRTGSKKGVQVDFGTWVSSSSVLKKMDLLNAVDYAQTANARAAATGGNPIYTQAQIDSYRQNGGTDWQNEVLRRATGQQYQLGISGGTDKTQFLISTNYLDQDGIINNTDYKRYTFRTNVSSQVSKKFTARVNLTGSRRESHNTDGTSARGGALAQALAWSPTTPVYTPAGTYTKSDPVGSIFQNPKALTTEQDNRYNNSTLNLVGGLRYEFIKGLSLDIQYGVNYINAQGKTYLAAILNNNHSRASRTSTEVINLQNTNTLSYRRTFNNIHSLDITAVFENQTETSESFNAGSTDLTFPNLSYDNLAQAGSNSVGSGYSRWALLSYLGRINYTLKDRYMISAAARRDGSSKFRGSNKYSNFPSVSLGWRISEENFMQTQNFVSNLKLRASWGLTGNQAIGPYSTMSTYISNLDDAAVPFTSGYFSTGINYGIVLGAPGNPDLKWETTAQTDVGVDIEVLEGKVSLSADYFVKNTKDLLLAQSLPEYVGGNSLMRNIGEVQNKGIELALNATPVRGELTWNSSLNFSSLKNKVVSLATNDTIYNVGGYQEFVLIPGQSLGVFWGPRYLGTWKPGQQDEAALFHAKPGDAHYEDLNGDHVIDGKDSQVIGRSMPKTTLGWNNTVTYKGLSLNIFFQGIFGFDKLNYSYATGIVGSTDVRQPTFADIQNRYIPGVNETSNIPAFSSTNENFIYQSSRFIEKGNFVRLKNISLAYTLPKAAVKGLGTVRVFVSGTNLWTITDYKGIDPESTSNSSASDAIQNIDHGSYPNSKTYTAGVNLTF